MSDEIRQSIQNVERAIEHLNMAFDKKADELKEKGNTEEFNQWVQAKAAMRDSGVIYLSWARHYARASFREDDDEMREDEMFEFPPGP